MSDPAIPRLPPFAPAELDADQRAVYDAIAGGRRAAGPQAFPLTGPDGELRGPFNAMLLSPPVGGALQAVGAAVRYRSVLDDRGRELAILAVAAHWGSAFERAAHEAVGRTAGLTDEDFAAVRTGTVPPSASTAEAVILRVVGALLAAGEVDDTAYADAVGVVGERGLFELTTLVGYYSTLALQLRVFAGEAGDSR
ncbi:carboxymuconolactone decarboxylase family protein [Cryptosporangium sp. NPDC051539]|uniref:carboxymuconolactone decarboxylase family protein n=1 Tax=Cryptosporangium sp. NPDC051539 TaxID=3363962 RepID=UPI00378E1721